MIVAFDPNDGLDAKSRSERTTSNAALPSAISAPTSYVWDGRYGLESSTPFPEAINKINRDAELRLL